MCSNIECVKLLSHHLRVHYRKRQYGIWCLSERKRERGGTGGVELI